MDVAHWCVCVCVGGGGSHRLGGGTVSSVVSEGREVVFPSPPFPYHNDRSESDADDDEDDDADGLRDDVTAPTLPITSNVFPVPKVHNAHIDHASTPSHTVPPSLHNQRQQRVFHMTTREAVAHHQVQTRP